MSTNDVTGDALRSKELSPEGKKNWDLIFGNPVPECDTIEDEVAQEEG